MQRNFYFRIRWLLTSLGFLIPALSLAQSQPGCGSIGSIQGLFTCFTNIIIYSAVPLLGLLAFFFFVWGLTMYIKNYDEPAKREDSRQFMIYGIIALFIMISIPAILYILANTFGFSSGTPSFQGGRSSGNSNSSAFPYGGNNTPAGTDAVFGSSNAE